MSSQSLGSTQCETDSAASSPIQLKRSLSFADLVFYGLVFISPVSLRRPCRASAP